MNPGPGTNLFSFGAPPPKWIRADNTLWRIERAGWNTTCCWRMGCCGSAQHIQFPGFFEFDSLWIRFGTGGKAGFDGQQRLARLRNAEIAEWRL